MSEKKSEVRNYDYRLPKDWRWVRLDDVCEKFVNGGTPDTSKSNYWSGDIPWITGADVKNFWVSGGRKYITEEGLNNSATHLVPKNTILVVTRTGVGKVCITENDLCFSQDITGLICTKEVYPVYLARFFLSQADDLMLIQRGATIKGLTRRDLKNLLIPLPPLPEQKRVASKIQELLIEVEQARTACERQLEVAKALPEAYLREVFESEEANKWEMKKLGDVCKLFSGSSAPQDIVYFKKGAYPFVRVQDLGRYNRTNNLINFKDYVNDYAIKELKLIRAKKGTILFPKSGAAITTNNRAILGIDAFIVSHLAALSPKAGIADNHYIYYWLCLIDMKRYMENPGYPSLKLSMISKIKIPLPEFTKQQRIVKELEDKMALVNKISNSIKKQYKEIKSLPQAILRKAFRGEL